jgi:hypothetical protein
MPNPSTFIEAQHAVSAELLSMVMRTMLARAVEQDRSIVALRAEAEHSSSGLMVAVELVNGKGQAVAGFSL